MPDNPTSATSGLFDAQAGVRSDFAFHFLHCLVFGKQGCR